MGEKDLELGNLEFIDMGKSLCFSVFVMVFQKSSPIDQLCTCSSFFPLWTAHFRGGGHLHRIHSNLISSYCKERPFILTRLFTDLDVDEEIYSAGAENLVSQEE